MTLTIVHDDVAEEARVAGIAGARIAKASLNLIAGAVLARARQARIEYGAARRARELTWALTYEAGEIGRHRARTPVLTWIIRAKVYRRRTRLTRVLSRTLTRKAVRHW